MKYVLIGLLKAWRLLVSPWYGNVCRYYPSCSAYALRAVQYHGALRGTWLAARRLLSCHPWSAGGYDPVRGTPEFEDEMRERRLATDTMGSADVGHHDHRPTFGPGQQQVQTEEHVQNFQQETSQGEIVAGTYGRGDR